MSANSVPRAIPSAPRPAFAWPTPGNVSDHRNASRGETVGPGSSCRSSAAKDVPQTLHSSSSIGFCAPQVGHGHGRVAAATLAAPHPTRVREHGLAAGAGSGSGAGRSDAKHWPHHSRVGGHERPRSSGHRRSSTRASVPSAPARTVEASQPAAASRSQPASRSATRGHVCSRSTRARPVLPEPTRVGRILQQVATRVGHPLHVRAVDEEPRLSVYQRLARAAGVADDDRAPAGGGLDEDVAPPLHLETGQAGPARHREDVADRVVAREVLLGHLAGERHRPVGRPLGERPELRLVRARRRRSTTRPRGRGAGSRASPGSTRPVPCGRRAGSHRRSVDGRRARGAHGGRRSAGPDGTARRRLPGAAPRRER